MGKTKFFYGTMSASKSAQLLMQAYNFEKQGKSFLIFKPSTDSRDGQYVKSRALNEKRHAIIISSSDDSGTIKKYCSSVKPDFLFIDEVQFFTSSQIEEFSLISRDFKIPIFAYGLLLDYTGKLFEGSKKAIECGFTLHELKMQCDFCKEKSTHHLLYENGKIIKDGSGVHVGDTEYKSVCYNCFSHKYNK